VVTRETAAAFRDRGCTVIPRVLDDGQIARGRALTRRCQAGSAGSRTKTGIWRVVFCWYSAYGG